MSSYATCTPCLKPMQPTSLSMHGGSANGYVGLVVTAEAYETIAAGTIQPSSHTSLSTYYSCKCHISTDWRTCPLGHQGKMQVQ